MVRRGCSYWAHPPGSRPLSPGSLLPPRGARVLTWGPKAAVKEGSPSPLAPVCPLPHLPSWRPKADGHLVVHPGQVPTSGLCSDLCPSDWGAAVWQLSLCPPGRLLRAASMALVSPGLESEVSALWLWQPPPRAPRDRAAGVTPSCGVWAWN